MNKEPEIQIDRKLEDLVYEYQSGNSDALVELLERCDAYCYKYVNEWYKNSNHKAEREDLFQEANLGLIEAAGHYKRDNETGACFLTYASNYVLNKVTRFCSKVSGPVILPYHKWNEVLKVAKLDSENSNLEYEDRVLKIAKEKGFTKKRVLNDLRLHIQFVSNVASPSIPYLEEEEVPWERYVQNRCEKDVADYVCNKVDLENAIEVVVNDISDFELRCFAYHYGLFGILESMTYEDISEELGVSKADIKKAVKKVMAYMRANLDKVNCMAQRHYQKKKAAERKTVLSPGDNMAIDFSQMDAAFA